MKVGKEVARVKSLPKEFQASRLGPGRQAGGEQAQVQVQGVKENCPHLELRPIFWGSKLEAAYKPQTLSSSRKS